MRCRLGVVGTLLLVVLAGCNAPLADGVETSESDTGDRNQVTTRPATPEPYRDVGEQTPYPETPTPRAADVEVNRELPVDADKTFARVRQLLDARTDPPRVEVYTGPTVDDSFDTVNQDRFETVLGIGPPQPADADTLQVGGLTYPTGTVSLVPRAGRAPEIERTLAHEFTHTVQFSQGARRKISSHISDERRETSDGRLTERSILEGAAVYSASEYVKRYQPRYPTERTQIARLYSEATAGSKLYWSAYGYGADYVRSRVDEPGDLPSVYRSPPSTTEQLLHNSRDEPVELGVDAADGDSRWFVRERDSRGELFTRIALATDVPADRARTAAAGWGNDELLTFDGRDSAGFVWITRWDDAANATEFATVTERFLDSHATPGGETWENDRTTYRLERVGDTTVAFLAGPERFVSETVVHNGSTSVTVDPPTEAEPT